MQKIQIMNLIDMTHEKRFVMMRKRHAFLSETVKGYTSLEEYARDKDEWFAIIGIILTKERDMVSLAVILDYNEREEYYVHTTNNGNFEISSEVWRVYGDNTFSMVDIFT